MGSSPRNVFVAGGTGYIGTRLIKALLRRGHQVRALARQGSERKLPAGAVPVTGDALHGISYAGQVPPSDTFVHLVGVSHPSPARAQDFLRIDLASVQAAVPAAVVAGIRNFVYVSVAHPAPVMRAYVAARMRAEEIIRSSGLAATMIRPWYVLGPGHRWPYAMVPVYWLLKLLPPTRAGALRLGLVTWRQMVSALVYAVEAPSDGLRVMEVPEIRAALDFQAI
jgi:uncharacterized protein YbjT (DUF2867 family)